MLSPKVLRFVVEREKGKKKPTSKRSSQKKNDYAQDKLEADVNLIWSNCCTYNAPSTIFHKMAVKLRALSERLFRSMRDYFSRLRLPTEAAGSPLGGSDQPLENVQVLSLLLSSFFFLNLVRTTVVTPFRKRNHFSAHRCCNGSFLFLGGFIAGTGKKSRARCRRQCLSR